MPLIEVKNIEKIYTSEGMHTPALRGVAFSIEKNEFVAIMGPSGSGKSTLLHILGFLERHTNGSYYFNGKTFDDYSSYEIAHLRNKKMGFIFQAFNLLARATVLENVKLPLLYSTVPEEKWDECSRKAIEEVQLTHRIHHKSNELSGGEKQRVAIARALVNDPQVIFADEPTGNLDTQSGEAIISIINKLCYEQGRTIILVTHEAYIAKRAGRIITMKDGTIESDRKL